MQDLLSFLSRPANRPLACGGGYSLITRDDAIYTCGLQADGNTIQWTPIPVPLSHVTSVACSDSSTLYLLEDGTTSVSGTNYNGELGVGSGNSMILPPQTPVVSVSLSESHSVVVLQDGTAYASGSNDRGELGDGTRLSRQTPVKMPVSKAVIAVACALQRTYLLLLDGSVYYSGKYGYLNVPDELGHVELPAPAVELATSPNHTLFLLNDGRVMGMGWDQCGQLGHGLSTNSKRPVRTTAIEMILPLPAIHIACAGNHSLALLEDGSVWGCGSNSRGQLASKRLGIQIPKPLKLDLPPHVTAIATGTYHSLFSFKDGSVRGCGDNGSGQLGVGFFAQEGIPSTKLQF